jgi:hypothetical protein
MAGGKKGQVRKVDSRIFVDGVECKRLSQHVMPDHPEEAPLWLKPRIDLAELLDEHFGNHYLQINATWEQVSKAVQELPRVGLVVEVANGLSRGIEAITKPAGK